MVCHLENAGWPSCRMGRVEFPSWHACHPSIWPIWPDGFPSGQSESDSDADRGSKSGLDLYSGSETVLDSAVTWTRARTWARARAWAWTRTLSRTRVQTWTRTWARAWNRAQNWSRIRNGTPMLGIDFRLALTRAVMVGIE